METYYALSVTEIALIQQGNIRLLPFALCERELRLSRIGQSRNNVLYSAIGTIRKTEG